MDFNIRGIPQDKQRFTTLGDWWEDELGLQIRITNMHWKYQVAILMHELIEFSICKSEGITTEECDAFDTLFEQEYESGKWPKSVEAGFDRRCPYRRGHWWGDKFERLTIFLLGGTWKSYLKACDEAINS